MVNFNLNLPIATRFRHCFALPIYQNEEEEFLAKYFEVPKKLLDSRTFKNWKKSVRCLDTNLFAFLPYLENVDISNCGIRVIQCDQFGKMERLELLRLQNNQIKFIQPRAFINLNNLKFLNLSSGHIQVLNAKMFVGLDSLEGLNLSRNKIEKIDNKVFSSLKKLTFLDLSFNLIKKIKMKTFAHLKNLQSLLLFNNSIVLIEKNSFESLTNLKFLLIHNNESLLKLESEVLVQIWRKLDKNVYKNVMIENKSSYFVENSESGLRAFRNNRNKTAKRECLGVVESVLSILLEDKKNKIFDLARKYFSLWHQV
jgi:Leucine-rich repeat (LRR) protein